MTDYQPVPVVAAERIALSYAKSQVVILAWDDVFKMSHVTTYGVSAGDKVLAAETGEQLSRVLPMDNTQRKTYEDFRTDFDAGLLREVLELLTLICGRQGVTGPLLEQAERILKAQGIAVRRG